MGKWIFCLYLLVLSLWDVKEQRIPVWLLTLGSVAYGSIMAFGLITGQMTLQQPVLGSLPGVLLLVLAWLSGKVGYADGFVLLWIGMLWGYREGLITLCVSLLLISWVSIVLLVLRKVKRQSKMPYIPFLTAGFLIVTLAMGG